jgi:cyclic-di-GMP phosphodiesterase TipF (flagellum assembly factor)
MIRLSALFVAICMVLIAGAFGAVLYLVFALTGAEAVAVALSALTALAIYNSVALRGRYQGDAVGQINDLSRGTADLARQVAEQGRRIAMLEKDAELAVNKALAATRPMQDEIGELGGLVSQLAETVAAQEIAWRSGDPPDERAPSVIRPGARPEEAAGGRGWKPILPVGQAAATLPPDELGPSVQAVVDEIDSPPIDQAAPASRAAPGGQAPLAGQAPPAGHSPPITAKVPGDGPFRGLSRGEIISLVGEAVGQNRIELFLQPVVTLPHRKVRYYEALMRLRMPDDRIVVAADFLPYAQASGLLPEIDHLMLSRCVRVVRRLQAKNRDVGVLCNISGATLTDPVAFPRILDLVQANRALASALTFEIPYAVIRGGDLRESESISALTDLGFRISVDHVTDLRFDPGDLAGRKCAFVKIPAAVLLDPHQQASAKIHLADLSGLLARFGMDLVAEKIENESTVVDLFDFDVKFAQGNLFSPPRPIRPESMEDVAPPAQQPAFDATASRAAPARQGVAQTLRSTAERASALARLARASSTRS